MAKKNQELENASAWAKAFLVWGLGVGIAGFSAIAAFFPDFTEIAVFAGVLAGVNAGFFGAQFPPTRRMAAGLFALFS